MSYQDPNHFTDDDFKSNPQESKDRLASLPRKSDGSFDIEAMDTDQKAIFWEEKARASSRGFHDYKQKTDREIELLQKNGVLVEKPQAPQTPDRKAQFRALGITDESVLESLARMTDIARDEAVKAITGNPMFVSTIAGSRQSLLDQAFSRLAQEEGYEPVLDYKQEIIERYFPDALSIPDDPYAVLKPIAGGVLYEHRAEIAEKSKPKHDRVDMLGGQGGDKKVAPTRSLEYWERLAQENPQEFTKPEVQKLFNEDMAKLKE